MRITLLIVLSSIASTGSIIGQEVDLQVVEDFSALVASVSKVEPVPLLNEESGRLRYCVEDETIGMRKNAILAKARLIDPGDKSNGKQSLRVAAARLVQDINDRKALENIIITAPYDGKDAHFTKLGLAYIYGHFSDRLPQAVLDAFSRQAAEYSEYLGRGTENHIGMQRISAAIFGAAYPGMQTRYGISGEAMEAIATQWIEDYGKAVYRAGMKEYLSPIYLGVHNEIWLTGAEGGPTPSVRLMSQAMLDWIWTDLAINAHLGQVMPPFTRAKVMLDRRAQASFPNSHAQFLSWLYWGDLHSRPGQDRLPAAVQAFSDGMTSKDMIDRVEGFQTALLPAASTSIPNEIIRNIGAKNIALPYMLLQSRPHGNVLSETANNPYNGNRNYREKDVFRNHLRSVYVARNYSLGGGYFRPDDSNDNEQYKHLLPSSLVYRSTDDFNSIIVSHPYWYASTPHGNEEEANQVFGMDCWLGKSPYEQMLHWENTIIYMYDIPDVDESAQADLKAEEGKWIAARRQHPLKAVCFYVPETIDEIRKTDWGWFLREGDVYIALRIAGSQNAFWETCSNPVQKGYQRLVSEGALQALVVEMGDAREYGGEAAFIARIGNAQLDLKAFQSKKQIRYVSTRGIPFDLRFNTAGWFPIASVKNVALDFEQWPTCESPYVSCRDGVLRVNDGTKGFTVDWSGNEPRYSRIQPVGNN